MEWCSIKRNLLAGLVVFVFAAASAWAQTGTTSVHGVVTDKSGAVIAKAKATLFNASQALRREVSTNNAGEYEFLSLPPGTYSLSVEMSGFRKAEQRNIQLLVNLPTTINISLEIGTATETVEVSSQAVALNATDASLGEAFNERQVKELPIEGRNIPDLLSLQAGVVFTSNRDDINLDVDTRSGAVNGAHSDQSNITLDGVDVNPSGGYAFKSVLPVTPDSVQEFRVTTTNYNADQGRSSGAQVALVTKSGTNSWHGSAYEYHRNTYTSANDWFVKRGELNSGQPNQPPKLIRNVFGASVGGPILKDRFFAFLNYEGGRRREESSAFRTVPSDTMRDGIIFYPCADSTQCTQTSVIGVSGKSYPVPTGMFGVDNSTLKAMDPRGLGANPAMLTYFKSFPEPNDLTANDKVNYVGFRFRGPVAINYNYYIARADYNLTANGNHKIFWSGALSNFANPEVPYLPGQAPTHSLVNYNKGFSLGYTGVLRSNLINNFRWGFVRESIGDIGNSNQQWIFFRGLNDSAAAVTRSRAFQRPLHNFTDDISWIRGKHTLQFGGAVTLIRNPRFSTLGSFSDGATNASWLDTSGFLAKPNSPFSPLHPANAALNLPAPNTSFANSYDFPMIALLGMVTEVDASYNYNKDGSVFAQGAPVRRRFAFDGYEIYGQDVWKIKPNLTFTYGLRYSLFSPPWETNGLEATPSFSLGDWFNKRGQNMLKGIPSNQDRLVTFNLAGPSNGKPGFYDWQKKNLGPRLALAWTPRANGGLFKSLFGDGGKSTIRAGAGIVYDRVGAGLLDTFDSRGAFGLSTGLSNPAGVETACTSPRLSDVHVIPTQDLGCASTNTAPQTIFLPAPPGKFPQTFPNTLSTGGFAIAWGLDNHVKNPYTYALDLSIGRELPKNFSIEVSYVGHLSHWLWVQQDLAMPLDMVDQASKVNYFSAATALAKLYRKGIPTSQITPAMVGPTAAYWQNMTQPTKLGGAYSLVCSGGSTTSALQANYDLFSCFSQNETTALFVLDLLGIEDATDDPMCGQTGHPSCTFYFPSGGQNTYFNSQYSSLYAWRSTGNANYHAMQVNLRHRMSHGVQFDFNYTYSKSIDLSSDAERIGAWSGLGGQVINSWKPNALRAISDFDTPHQINANWIAELPFGRGHLIAPNANKALDGIIGGWQLSGVFRWTTGFPVNIYNGFQWPTNWQLGGDAVRIAPVSTHTTKNPDGSVSMFKNPAAALAAFRAGFPGESGTRNPIRGDGTIGIDLGLSKSWQMPWSEKQRLRLVWEVFNVTNTNRFDVQSNPPEIDISTTFGNYQGLLSKPRVMEFALRYEF
jgi:hypothetical protein